MSVSVCLCKRKRKWSPEEERNAAKGTKCMRYSDLILNKLKYNLLDKMCLIIKWM